MGDKRRRECKVRPLHGRFGLDERHSACRGNPRRARPAPLPCRLAGARYPDDQPRHPRGRPLLREAPQDGPLARLPRRRRRTRRRLRRFPYQLRQLAQLQPARIHPRHRLQHHGDLRLRAGRASRDRERERPLHRRPALGARHRGLRFDREGRNRRRRCRRARRS